MKKLINKKLVKETLNSMKPINSATRERELELSRIRVWNIVSYHIDQNDYTLDTNKPKMIDKIKNREKALSKTAKAFIGFSFVALTVATTIGIGFYGNPNFNKSTSNQTNKPLAVQLDELYSISKTNLKETFNGQLTDEDFEAIVQKVDSSKVTYSKNKVTYLTDENNYVGEDGKTNSYLRNLKAGDSVIDETWENNSNTKRVVKQNNQTQELYVQTPNLHFSYKNGEDVTTASKKVYTNIDQKDSYSWGNPELSFLENYINSHKDFKSGKLPSWYLDKLVKIEKKDGKTRLEFERYMNSSDSAQQKESKDCFAKNSKEGKSTKGCSLPESVFVHTKTYIDIYPNSTVIIAKTEDFNKSGKVTKSSELVDHKIVDFSNELFNYNELPKNISIKEQTVDVTKAREYFKNIEN